MMSLFSPFFRHTFYSSLLFTAEPFIAAAVVFHVPRIKGRGKSSSPVIGNTDTAVIDNPPRIICKTYFFLLLHLGVRRAGGKVLGSDSCFFFSDDRRDVSETAAGSGLFGLLLGC